MFPPIVRIPLIVLVLAGGVYLIATGQSRGWLLILAAAGFTYGHFRYSSVWAAFQALKRGSPARARSLIQTVRRPDRLNRQHLAYYHFVNGFLCLEDDSLAKAKEHFLAAADGSLRTTNDRCVVLLTLAEIEARAGDPEAAREYLSRAHSTPHKRELAAAFDKVESMIEASVKE